MEQGRPKTKSTRIKTTSLKTSWSERTSWLRQRIRQPHTASGSIHRLTAGEARPSEQVRWWPEVEQTTLTPQPWNTSKHSTTPLANKPYKHQPANCRSSQLWPLDWGQTGHRKSVGKPAQPKLQLIMSYGATLMILICCLLAASHCRAYQLTNNLIANNLPPKFATGMLGQATSSEIVVRIKEGAGSIGKLIYTLRGEDPDEDPLTFGVLGSMASDLLRIENISGNQANVYLRKELDRETTESYQVVITLTDGKLGRGNWITKSMLIIVEDVNDNHPVFKPHRTAISIREDARVPLVVETVEASDQDEGRFGQVIYKLDYGESSLVGQQQQQQQSGELDSSSRSISNMFVVDTVDGKGVISLIQPLDYEQKALYQLRIIAVDRAIEQERLSASTSILVSVEDCEDQAPMFTFVPSITRISEALPVGSPVVRVTALDGDRGINNPIQYRLLTVNGQEAGSERDLFAMDAESGWLSVAQELDRERTPADAATGQRHISQQPGTYVLQVSATESSSSSASSSSSMGAQSVTTELTVILTDVNDETPTFDQSHYYGEILENSGPENIVTLLSQPPGSSNSAASGPEETTSTQLIVAKVVDMDQGTNGTFTLHLEGEHSHLFEVWPREATNEASITVKIASSLDQATAAAHLDFEQNKVFQLTLVAMEKYQALDTVRGQAHRRASSRAKLSVYLKDANDNYPQFESDLYRAEIPENAIRGMHICTVRAMDADSGPLGSSGIRYTEIRGEKASKFKLDPLSGVITLKTSDHGFDRETIGQHHLIVEARDNDGLGNRNTSQLLIVLSDVNDQKPKFLLEKYEAFIYENELDFHTPLQVQAMDNDASNSLNSKLTYSIVGGDPQHNFTIDPTTGRIRVRTSLVSTTTNQPQTALRGSVQQQHHHLLGADEPQLADQFRRQPQVVLQAVGLDFEWISQKRDEACQFNLTVRVSDSGLPEPLMDETQVLITVYDKNDHAPVFAKSLYSKSIREDAREGSLVVQVSADDGDHSTVNSKISYRISSGDNDKFIIDSETGIISVANGASLDIDWAGGGHKRTNYQLNVLASDGHFGANQKFASALVNITVLDVNNKSPEFVSLGASSLSSTATLNQATTTATSLPMTVYVNEDAPYGLVITRVSARDLDSDANLRYSINWARSEARNEDMLQVEPSLIKDLFTIDSLDGTIKVARQLDRESFDQVKLRLQVEDLAAQTPDQVAQANLFVRITDINDNRPLFKRPVHKAVVNENSISGTSVITVTADDRDLNKTLRYSLEGPPEMVRLVRVNPKSGEVTVNDKIDRELCSLINVTIKAEDFGQPQSLAGTAQLLISVRDENDNNPMFLNETRDEQVGGQRWPRNESIRHRSTSAIPLNLPLLGPNSVAKVREDAPSGYQVAYVRADDADAGSNGRVTYLLEGTSSGGKFHIDRDTGIISVSGQLDRESQRQYTLIIEACDNYDVGYSTGESRRAFAQVSILVTDMNDNAPVISTNLFQKTNQPQFAMNNMQQVGIPQLSHEEIMNSPGPYEVPLNDCLFINEFQALNEPILTVMATDADDPTTLNGQIELNIINTNGELFSLSKINQPPVDQPAISISTSGSMDPLVVEENAPVISASAREPRLSGSHQQYSIRRQLLHTTTTPHPLQQPSATLASIRTPMMTNGDLGEQQAHIVLLQSLKERVGNYSLLIRASDKGQPALSSVKAINICVQDVNNHPPVFVGPALNRTIRVMENATIGTPVLQLFATDLDHGSNGEIQFSLKPIANGFHDTTSSNNKNNDWQSFKINRSTGLITTTKLFNRQLKKYYSLRVQAQDFGKPTPLSSDIDISIMIVNSAQYQPEFDNQLQTVQFTENVPSGQEYVILIPTTNQDDDPALLGTGQTNSNQSTEPCYFIVGGDDKENIFQLDRYTHRLTNSKPLDREQQANYTLLVQATNSCNKEPQQQNTPPSQIMGHHLLVPTESPLDNMSTGSEQLISSSRDMKNLFRRRSGSGDSLAVEDQTTIIPSSTNDINKRLTNESHIETGTSKLQLAASMYDYRLGLMNQVAVDALLASDKSLLKVFIKVKDVNDNGPKFTQKIYTGGFTTEADFGTVFMIVQATDADLDQQIAYSILKPIKRNVFTSHSSLTASESAVGADTMPTRLPASRRPKRSAYPSSSIGEQAEDSLAANDIPLVEGDDLFVVNAQTGEISVNFDPQKHMKGYFEFTIVAKDNDGLSDSAKVFIYLLRQDQRVKFVLRLTPQELRQRLNKFRGVFGNITGAIVNIDSYKYYENHDGTVDKKKTSLFLHFVNPDDNTIIEVDKVLALIDRNIEYLNELYKEFHVLSSDAAYLPLSSSALIDPIDQVRTGLLGISSFLALILILVIALCLNQRTRYERQLKAATVSAFGSSPLHLDSDYHSHTNLPNTNLHSQDPNPIWINGYNEQDWLGGADGPGAAAGREQQAASGGKSGSGHQPAAAAIGGKGPHHQHHHNNTAVSNSRSTTVTHMSNGCEKRAASSGIEQDLDYLSSAENSDVNSFSGLNSVSGAHLHYNNNNNAATTTATPRDSLTRSQADRNSGSGSASTTNERQVLCSANRGGNNGKQQQHQVSGGEQQPADNHKSASAKLASARSQPAAFEQQQQQQQHSTFGAYKEVTIYTDHLQRQQVPPMQYSQPQPVPYPITNPDQQQQQQHPGSYIKTQVNKIASQFNAKQLQPAPTTAHNNSAANQQSYSPAPNEAANQQRATAQAASQAARHRILVHANGADVNQGIIKAPTGTKSNLNSSALKADSALLAKQFAGANEQQARFNVNSDQTTVENFESNLSKLSILNLETTEL